MATNFSLTADFSMAKDELRVGLLSPTAARQMVRLPQGNQAEVLDTVRREALSGAELAAVVYLWLGFGISPRCRGAATSLSPG